VSKYGRTKSPVSTEPDHITWILLLGLVYLLLVGVGSIGAGFKWISGGADGAERIFAFATNPLFGVILGTLATSLVQSSSTVTSVIVGLVAGGLPVGIAIPMVMGANMGTTITNSIVSLGSLREGKSFGRSFGAATVHDFFNLYSILLILPLELLLHPLEQAAAFCADLLAGTDAAAFTDLNVVSLATRPLTGVIQSLCGLLPAQFGAGLMIVVGIGLVVGSVLGLGRLLSTVMTGKAGRLLDNALDRGVGFALLAGALITILVQSSSTTTSLVVPLAGAGILTLRQVYPFTMGANVGTCVTALLAASGVAGATGIFALQIALVHLFYNLLGIGLFLGVPFLKELPIRSAEWLGARSERNRGAAIVYIVGVFFLLPGAVFGIQSLLNRTDERVLAAEADTQQLEQFEQQVEQSDFRIE